MPTNATRVVLLLAAALNLIPLAYTGLLIAPGTTAGGSDDARLRFIADHALLWSAGWTLWMGGTIGLVLSIWAIARAMQSRALKGGSLLRLAVIFAVVGGATDLVGDAIQITVLPTLAQHYVTTGQADPGASTITLLFDLADHLITALSAGTANTLYFVAGLLVVIAQARIATFPRWLTALGGLAWLVTLAATPAVFFPTLLPVFVAGALALYSAWLVAIAIWGLDDHVRFWPQWHLRRV